MNTQGLTGRPGLMALGACVALAAAGCGGGGGSGSTPAPPGVSGVTVSNARYSQTARFDVAGTGLDQLTLSVASSACRAAPVATGTATSTQASFSCVIGTTGATTAVVSSAGTAVVTQAYTVGQPQVTLTLDQRGGVSGSIVVALELAKAPRTVDNFLAYVNSGFYAGTLLHRVAPGFVVQGGGYTSVRPSVTLKATNGPIALEIGPGLSNVQGSVAMARLAGADTATSQFFINLDNNGPSLDGLYAVFGSVVSGTTVVSAVERAACTPLADLGGQCVPNTDIVITAATQTQ